MKSRDVDSVLPLARNLDEDPKSVPSFMASINGGVFSVQAMAPWHVSYQAHNLKCCCVHNIEIERDRKIAFLRSTAIDEKMNRVILQAGGSICWT